MNYRTKLEQGLKILDKVVNLGIFASEEYVVDHFLHNNREGYMLFAFKKAMGSRPVK